MTSHVRPGSPSDQHGDPATGLLPVGLRAILATIIVAGLALRLVYPGTTVFCEDQAHACALAEDIVNGHWQAGGLINSGGFRNLPGFVYLLAAVWWVWPDPLALLYFIGIVNVVAVLVSAYLMRRWIGTAGAWWGTAFLAAGPWAIHYSRWIWAQDLLFPVATLTYVFLWQWLCRQRKWAALGVVLSLTLLVQIHLVGVVLALATGLLILWCRLKPPVWPVLVGAVLAIGSVLPYMLEGHLGAPKGNRVGYPHVWRVVPAAAMSVTGAGWRLEFRGGYPAFAQSLDWRRWPYESVMGLSALLLGAGVVMSLRRLWQNRGDGLADRRTPLAMVAALVILIPLSFVVMGLRTSPTYLPLWYPLPFVLMGRTAVQMTERPARGHGRTWIAPILVAVLCVQLLFFVEQLRYIHVRGGVPGSGLGRSYAGMKSDIADLASRVDAAEIWMLYEGASPIQDEPAAYLLRHAEWAGRRPERALVHFRWGSHPDGEAGAVETLADEFDPGPEAYLLRPWLGPQQRGSEIPFGPE